MLWASLSSWRISQSRLGYRRAIVLLHWTKISFVTISPWRILGFSLFILVIIWFLDILIAHVRLLKFLSSVNLLFDLFARSDPYFGQINLYCWVVGRGRSIKQPHFITKHLHCFESVLDSICFKIFPTFFACKIVLEFKHGFRCGSLPCYSETLDLSPESSLLSSDHSKSQSHFQTFSLSRPSHPLYDEGEAGHDHEGSHEYPHCDQRISLSHFIKKQ